MSDESKQYKVVVYDDAVQMLNSHVRFVANVSISAARKLRADLYKACKSLETMPHRCPVYHMRRVTGTYRKLVISRYQIVYSISEQDCIVYVKYVLDSRQDSDI